MKLSYDELRSIALEIYEDGFTYSEAHSSRMGRKWKARGWPEKDPLFFKIIDAFLRLFRDLEAYGLTVDTAKK